LRRKRRRLTLVTILFTIICIGLIIYLANTKTILKHIYTIKYQEEVYQYSKQYKVDPLLVFAIIKVESNFNKFAVSNKDAKGLMQITDKTGIWASEVLDIKDFSPSNLFDHRTNIRIGCWYLDRLRTEFNGDMLLAITAYNGGSGRVKEWLNNKDFSQDGEALHTIPFNETDKYVKRVVKEYQMIKYIYGNE
jgi:soluble lytic murein transglycosylase